MTRLLTFACAVALLCAAPASAQVSVSIDRTKVATTLGHDFDFRTTVLNEGSATTAPLVAHLNILTLRPGVYVDPEDWSERRTVFIDPIPPGGSRSTRWRVKAVNSGEIGVYVAVLPRSGPAEPPVTSPAIHVSIAERRTLNSGGILPLAVGIPALLALLTVGVRLRRRAR